MIIHTIKPFLSLISFLELSCFNSILFLLDMLFQSCTLAYLVFPPSVTICCLLSSEYNSIATSIKALGISSSCSLSHQCRPVTVMLVCRVVFHSYVYRNSSEEKILQNHHVIAVFEPTVR